MSDPAKSMFQSEISTQIVYPFWRAPHYWRFQLFRLEYYESIKPVINLQSQSIRITLDDNKTKMIFWLLLTFAWLAGNFLLIALEWVWEEIESSPRWTFRINPTPLDELIWKRHPAKRQNWSSKNTIKSFLRIIAKSVFAKSKFISELSVV